MEVKGGEGLLNSTRPYQLYEDKKLRFLSFENIPNRNSIQYQALLNIPDDVETMYRGTLRFKGFTEIMLAFVRAGFLSTEKMVAGDKKLAWKKIFSENKQNAHLLNALEFFKINENSPFETDSKFDELCLLFSSKMQMEKNDKDLVVLEHRFGVLDKAKPKIITKTLVLYGKENESAMSRTVGVSYVFKN